MIASAEGGMNIEEVAETNPEAIIKMPMHPDGRREPEKCAEVARRLGFSAEQVPKVADTLDRLYHLFEQCDATMVEINPLAELEDGTVLPFDAKLNFDDNAEPRQKEIFALRDSTQEDPRDVEAEAIGVAYVGLDGNVGCIANGAGEAMATLDALALYGGSAANFLDCGGSATREQVTEIFKLLLKDDKVKVIFVNIFAGIARADVIAEGVIAAARELSLTVPVVARLCGTGADRAAELISASGLDIIAENDLDKAAAKAAELAK
jgi:succinyl-CoA synthetase beta subunit